MFESSIRAPISGSSISEDELNLLRECDLERANIKKRNITIHFVIIPIATVLCTQARDICEQGASESICG